ncbi:hypothetical protein E5162_08740 [Marinicauda pacifica]|uniref:Uncharacterized protein n=2 Tax=Marinicauda pacifica TaxID=1133559 RepID=A0A4S2HD63_9PROT|nr:hypothetical protein E5162_08740 [Marinicauda pacifica]
MSWAAAFLGRPVPQQRATPSVETIDVSALHNDKRKNETLAGRIWRAAGPIYGTPAQTYLEARCGSLPHHDLTGVLRFHPQVWTDGGCHPALIAVMTDPLTGEPSGIHRTFLTAAGGKSPLGKRMLGSKGVIRLYPDEDVAEGLHLAEGIETALAAVHLYGLAPVWACGSAGSLEAFPVLTGIEHLTVLADNDASGRGEEAARVVCRAWAQAGREAVYMRPKAKGDFADFIGEAQHVAA